MCGIIAACAKNNTIDFIYQGLSKLTYRGYDSAGLATVSQQKLAIFKATGKLQQLLELVEPKKLNSQLAIAHTRWATHGLATKNNAHPHGAAQRLALVHNGIIENYLELKQQLAQNLVQQLQSETDSEIVAARLSQAISQAESYPGSLSPQELIAVASKVIATLRGSWALAIIDKYYPEQLIVAKYRSPVALVSNEHGSFIASDALALIGQANEIIFLEDGDLVHITPLEAKVFQNNQPVTRLSTPLAATAETVSLGGYKYYMHKEIFEQPRALKNTLQALLPQGLSSWSKMFSIADAKLLQAVEAIDIVACGSSYYAGLTGRDWLQTLAGIPTNVYIASEFAASDQPKSKASRLLIALSQSGETADTLAALEAINSNDYIATMAICNVNESSIVRKAQIKLITQAGPEIGVASTKAFTAQLYSLALLAGYLSLKPGYSETPDWLAKLLHIDTYIAEYLELEAKIAQLAHNLYQDDNCFILARGNLQPLALEGALKLKEISYIHAEAYFAGELKHGPLALITKNFPVLFLIANQEQLVPKLLSNIKEVQARGASLYIFADSKIVSQIKAILQTEDGSNIISLPNTPALLAPLFYAIPLQLLAYHLGLLRGNDIDQPRNLSKSVTVE